MDESLWSNREFMTRAIRCRWQCAQFLSGALRTSELFLEAIEKDVKALDFADDQQRSDRDFMLAAAKLQRVALRHLPAVLFEDASFWLAVIKEVEQGWSLAFEQGPQHLRDNIEAASKPPKGLSVYTA